MNWYKHAQAEYRMINPEDEEGNYFEHANQAEQIFRKAPLGVDSTKNISHVAIENGEVIGAVASGWQKDIGYGDEEVYVFAFDLAVKPEFRRKGVGLNLIQRAVAQYESDKSMYQEMGARTMMELHVVNPFLVPVLEQKFGFRKEEENPGGSVHMVRY